MYEWVCMSSSPQCSKIKKEGKKRRKLNDPRKIFGLKFKFVQLKYALWLNLLIPTEFRPHPVWIFYYYYFLHSAFSFFIFFNTKKKPTINRGWAGWRGWETWTLFGLLWMERDFSHSKIPNIYNLFTRIQFIGLMACFL